MEGGVEKIPYAGSMISEYQLKTTNMTGKFKNVIIFCLLALLPVTAGAQQVLSSGGYEKKSELTIDWLIGGSLTDLELNDHTVQIIATPEQKLAEIIGMKLYPVPVKDILNVEISGSDTCRVVLELLGSSGNAALRKITIKNRHTEMDLSSFPSGIYLLKASVNGLIFKSEKIVKN